jgi:hypothetical protein
VLPTSRLLFPSAAMEDDLIAALDEILSFSGDNLGIGKFLTYC